MHQSVEERAKSEDPVQREQRRLVKLLNTLCTAQVVSAQGPCSKPMQGAITVAGIRDRSNRQNMMYQPVAGSYLSPLNSEHWSKEPLVEEAV